MIELFDSFSFNSLRLKAYCVNVIFTAISCITGHNCHRDSFRVRVQFIGCLGSLLETIIKTNIGNYDNRNNTTVFLGDLNVARTA